MENFLLNKTQYYVDRISEFEILKLYITGNHEDLTKIDDKDNELNLSLKTERKVPLMLVTSPSGDGKTMLLAKFVLHLEVNANSCIRSLLIICHSLGDNERKMLVILLLH